MQSAYWILITCTAEFSTGRATEQAVSQHLCIKLFWPDFRLWLGASPCSCCLRCSFSYYLWMHKTEQLIYKMVAVKRNLTAS